MASQPSTHHAPPQPRIATTQELMMPYAADLVRMKVKGASHGQMISWLHTQGVMVNFGEIASFWPYLALQKQKIAPVIGKNPEPTENTGSAEKPKKRSEEKSPLNSPPVRHSLADHRLRFRSRPFASICG
jgi:hypothetical protein